MKPDAVHFPTGWLKLVRPAPLAKTVAPPGPPEVELIPIAGLAEARAPPCAPRAALRCREVHRHTH